MIRKISLILLLAVSLLAIVQTTETLSVSKQIQLDIDEKTEIIKSSKGSDKAKKIVAMNSDEDDDDNDDDDDEDDNELANKENNTKINRKNKSKEEKIAKKNMKKNKKSDSKKNEKKNIACKLCKSKHHKKNNNCHNDTTSSNSTHTIQRDFKFFDRVNHKNKNKTQININIKLDKSSCHSNFSESELVNSIVKTIVDAVETIQKDGKVIIFFKTNDTHTARQITLREPKPVLKVGNILENSKVQKQSALNSTTNLSFNKDKLNESFLNEDFIELETDDYIN
jgi:hypothetical protein